LLIKIPIVMQNNFAEFYGLLGVFFSFKNFASPDLGQADRLPVGVSRQSIIEARFQLSKVRLDKTSIYWTIEVYDINRPHKQTIQVSKLVRMSE
jgi:hypothetical protein